MHLLENFHKRNWDLRFTEMGTGSLLLFKINKHLLDIQPHKYTTTCCSGQMKGLSHKHSSCVEWTTLIVEKHRNVGLGRTRMWAGSVLCVSAALVCNQWKLSYLCGFCFILLQKKMQTHSHNHHKPNYHLYSLRKCQPNHFEVVFVAVIDSAFQEMQNIWLFIHSFIFLFECENYSFTVKLISFTVDHLSS